MLLQMVVSFSPCWVVGVLRPSRSLHRPRRESAIWPLHSPPPPKTPQLPMKSTPEFSPLDVTYCLLHLCGSATVTPSVGDTHRCCVAANPPPHPHPPGDKRELRPADFEDIGGIDKKAAWEGMALQQGHKFARMTVTLSAFISHCG